jgi:dTDP-glucose 4,6-dehydratase
MTNKVLITGGLGFIFSHVTEYLVKKGYKVTVLDNLSTGSHPEILNDSFKFYNVDVHAPQTIPLIVALQPDYIIHASAYSDVDVSIKNSHDIIKANCDANLNVFEASKQLPNLKKLVYVSTDEVYGECEYRKTEEDIIFPKNPYSFSKAHGSLLRLAYDNTYPQLKDKTAETRFCNIVGERQDTRKILPAIREALKNDTPLPVHNGGGGYREYMWVENIPPVVEIIMLRGNRTYNVTNNEGMTVNELIAMCEGVVGKQVKKIVSERPGMDLKYQMDSERVRKLGWRPTVTFLEGLKEYL